MIDWNKALRILRNVGLIIALSIYAWIAIILVLTATLRRTEWPS